MDRWRGSSSPVPTEAACRLEPTLIVFAINSVRFLFAIVSPPASVELENSAAAALAMKKDTTSGENVGVTTDGTLSWLPLMPPMAGVAASPSAGMSEW